MTWEIDSAGRLALFSSSRVPSAFVWNCTGMNCAITGYSLPRTLIGWPIRGCRTRIALALSQAAVSRVLVSMSSFLFWYWVTTLIMLFGGGGSSLSLFASQLFAAIFIFPVELGSVGAESLGGSSFCALTCPNVEPILQLCFMDVCRW